MRRDVPQREKRITGNFLVVREDVVRPGRLAARKTRQMEGPGKCHGPVGCPDNPDRGHQFFLALEDGRTAVPLLNSADVAEAAETDAVFLDLGFLTSRLLGFCPLAMSASCWEPFPEAIRHHREAVIRDQKSPKYALKRSFEIKIQLNHLENRNFISIKRRIKSDYYQIFMRKKQ